MKKLVKVVGLSLVVVSSAFFANAAQAAQKIGYVSTGYLISKLPQREAIMNKLQADLKDDRAELDKIRKSMESKLKKIERDGELLGKEGIQKLQIEIRSLQAEGQIKKDAFNQKAQSLDIQSRQKMIDMIQKAAAKVAKKEGMTMIVDSQVVLFSDDALNLTEKVLAELK